MNTFNSGIKTVVQLRYVCCVAYILAIVCVGPIWASPFSSLVVFGDSLSDTGNVNTRFRGIPPVPPYFEARFSNGPVWVERLASRLEVSPPVASENGGTNYAWGGATTGVRNRAVDDMNEQIEKYLASNAPEPDELFILWGGSNDFGVEADPSASVEILSAHISALAAAGARNFFVLNLSIHHTNIDHRVPEFNTLLALEINGLRNANDSLSILEFDYSTLVDDIMAAPESFGFTNVSDPACMDCGVGTQNARPRNIVPNPDAYFFWDDIHPSASAHEIIAVATFNVLIPEPTSLMLSATAIFCMVTYFRSVNRTKLSRE